VQVDRTVMLLNCGACEHVRQMLELPDAVRVIVIDAHRPIHHSYNNETDTSTLFLHDPADGTAAEDVPPASDSESSGSGDDASGLEV
jgi:CDC45-like protein